MAMMNSLKGNSWGRDEQPAEITRDILLRLPMKALKRFECVCKPWQDMIIDINQNRPRRLLYAPLNVNPKPILSIDYEAQNRTDGVAVKEVNCPVVAEPDTSVKFMGSCHGLVCLRIMEQDVLILWNPTTGQMKLFPKPPHSNDEGFRYSDFYGFGYVPSAEEDYKVVWGYSDDEKTLVEVFSFRTNVWTTYVDNERRNICMQDPQGCYLNGALHWMQLSYMKSSIISFDFARNMFTETLPLPDYRVASIHELSSLGIGVSNDRIFVHSGPDKPSFSIWVMQEFGVRESWTRILHIPATVMCVDYESDEEHDLKPVCFLDSGDVLMAEDEKDLVLYKSKTKTFKRIMEEGEDNSPIEILAYEETLLSLP